MIKNSFARASLVNKYYMDKANMPSEKVKYAGFKVRFLAYAIDLVLIYGIIMMFRLLFAIKELDELDELGILLLNIIYNIVMVASKYQATIGKICLKLIIVDYNMQRLSLLHSFGRCMSYYFSYITLGLGFVMLIFNKKHEGLHDRIAHSYVIYK